MKVDLHAGNWAELCELEEITRQQQRAYKRVLFAALYPDGTRPTYKENPDNPAEMIEVPPVRQALSMEVTQELEDMAFASCIRSWSFNCPVTPENLDFLSALDADRIDDELTKQGHYGVLGGAGAPKEKTDTEPPSSSTSEVPATSPTE